jgi:ketosteroid isomerase-like protein
MTGIDTREELRELALRYALAVDGRDADGLLALFTADGSVGGLDRSVPAFAGEAGLRQMIRQVEASFNRTMHNVYNQTFEIESGAVIASGETYCLASHIIEAADGSWQILEMAIRYKNDYRLDAGRWKFAQRRLDVQWVETRAAQKFTPDMLSKNPDKIL